jgi:ABC-type Fe3+-citrate transport system substrate-binding protein
MESPAVTKEKVVKALDELPPEQLLEVNRFIEFLHFKSEEEPKQVIRLGGLWKDLTPVTEEDIAEARREMWGRFGERKL